MKACLQRLNWLGSLYLSLGLTVALVLPWVASAQTNLPTPTNAPAQAATPVQTNAPAATNTAVKAAVPAPTNAPEASAKASNQPPAKVAVSLPVKGGNLFPAEYNGEKTAPLINYWDGVDAENDLHVAEGRLPVLDDAGVMVDTAMTSCPNFVDMNGDGLNDLVIGDMQGFLWIYLNSGAKGNPKFTTGTFLPTFLGWGAKLHVCDWDGDGDMDVIFGTFYGDIGLLENTGTRNQWQFTRRMGIPRYMDPAFGSEDPKDRLPTLMLGNKPMVLGNYMAPWVADWNKDGKPDLIVGEGTYSANSVRLLVNTGARNKPIFVEERMFFLAYGEGFEQLTPAVVDYNGDGLHDLIVGTRTGQIRKYKGTQKAIEGKDMVSAIRGSLAPAVLEFNGFITIADKEIFDVMSFVYPCDWNEDGLFDLLLGSTKGKVYIAVNQGTKTEPKFLKAEPVKGTDTEKDLLAPAGWNNGVVLDHCNAAILLSAEKELVLRAGGPAIKPVDGNYFMYFRYVHNYPGWMRSNFMGWFPPLSANAPYVSGGRFIYPPYYILPLKIRQQYEFSFSAIVEGKPVMWGLSAQELTRKVTDTAPAGYESRFISDVIPPSGAWQKRTYRFKAPNMVESNLNYSLYFRMPEGDVKFMLDNLSLKEVER